jgi:hypothetical protein
LRTTCKWLGMMAKANIRQEAHRGSPEMFLKAFAVDVIAYDILTAVAAGHEVVDRIGVPEA